MTCTVCGYAMSAFDSGCPRCAQQKAAPPTQPASEGNWTQPAAAPTQVAPQAPPQGGWTQPGQPQPHQVPPQGHPHQQPQPGYPPAYAQPLPAKKGINPVVIVVLVFFALCSLPIGIAVLTMVGGRVSNTMEEASGAPSTQPTTTSPAATPQVRMGPSFAEADSKMSSRQYQWTEAQQQAYWASIQGTRISWNGEITEVKTENGGSIMLKCNPKTFTFDVTVSLDGTQVDKLSTLSKGQRITIEGILDSHSTFGYTINQGRVSGL